MSNIKLGITLYSFSKEYITGEYSFEDCVRRCAEMGIDGYELVGTQMLPDYPYVNDDFLGEIHRLSALYGAKPVSYGANTDLGMRHDRNLNEQELLATTKRDIRTAQKLGCSVMRAQYLLSPKILGQLAPYAEAYGVKVGIEIHNPETPSSPAMQAYLEVIEKTGSDYIGFIPDFGCFADKPNIDSYEGALSRGADKQMLDFAVQLRYDQVPMPEAQTQLEQRGADPEVMKSFFNNYGFLTFYKNPDFDGLRRIMPHCFHFHGKFHHMLENGTERSIPYEKILPILDDFGYNGYIVSEYEGHHAGNALEMTRKHIAMERRILGMEQR